MKRKQLPWTEKYRPKSLDEISSQIETIKVLKKMVETQNMPHLLFYGPAGTGKTSTILAMTREMFGPNLAKERVLELNASDERGIGVIRTKIKKFAALSAVESNRKDVPPFKIIVLDEADWMTSDAQNALRRTMELYSSTTRFCLICNYISRIISPIASRCSKFRFKRVPKELAAKRIKKICESENRKWEENAIKAVISSAEGDLRRGITLQQSCSKVYGDDISAHKVETLANEIPNEIIDKTITTCHTENLDEIKECAQNLVLEAYPGNQILLGICSKIIMGPFEENQKALICQKVADAEFRLIEGADKHLQLLDVLCYINSVLLYDTK